MCVCQACMYESLCREQACTISVPSDHFCCSHTQTHVDTHFCTQVNKYTQGTHTPPGFPALGNRCGGAGAVPSSRGRMYGLACPPRKLFFLFFFPSSSLHLQLGDHLLLPVCSALLLPSPTHLIHKRPLLSFLHLHPHSSKISSSSLFPSTATSDPLPSLILHTIPPFQGRVLPSFPPPVSFGVPFLSRFL